MTAAIHANALTDRALAVDLGREALERGASPAASLAVGEALVTLGRFDEAIEILTVAGGDDDGTRARIAYWHSMAIQNGADDPDAACGARGRGGDPVGSALGRLPAGRSGGDAESGHDLAAAALTEELVDDADTDEIVKLRALTTVGRRWAVTGQAASPKPRRETSSAPVAAR